MPESDFLPSNIRHHPVLPHLLRVCDVLDVHRFVSGDFAFSILIFFFLGHDAITMKDIDNDVPESKQFCARNLAACIHLPRGVNWSVQTNNYYMLSARMLSVKNLADAIMAGPHVPTPWLTRGWTQYDRASKLCCELK